MTWNLSSSLGSLGLQTRANHAWLFRHGSGNWGQVLMLVCKALYWVTSAAPYWDPIYKTSKHLGLVPQAYHPSTWKAEAGRSYISSKLAWATWCLRISIVEEKNHKTMNKSKSRKKGFIPLTLLSSEKVRNSHSTGCGGMLFIGFCPTAHCFFI